LAIVEWPNEPRVLIVWRLGLNKGNRKEKARDAKAEVTDDL